MQFEYRAEKKLILKKREKERETDRERECYVVISFKMNARLSGWKAGILFCKAPNSPYRCTKSEEKSGFV